MDLKGCLWPTYSFFLCALQKKGTRIKLANEHSTETAHLKSVKRVFQLTYNPFFPSISSPCQKRHLQEHFSLCNGAADSAASTSIPETFIKLEMQTAQDHSLNKREREALLLKPSRPVFADWLSCWVSGSGYIGQHGASSALPWSEKKSWRSDLQPGEVGRRTRQAVLFLVILGNKKKKAAEICPSEQNTPATSLFSSHYILKIVTRPDVEHRLWPFSCWISVKNAKHNKSGFLTRGRRTRK